MKFSSIFSLTGLLAIASANYPAAPEDHYPEYYHVQYEKVICTDPAPYTKTETVTVTEYPQPTYPPIYTDPPYIVTDGPTVTSVDYYGDKTSVWVYPTGYGSHDCTVAVYEKNVIINVIIINIDITIINGETYTVTSTVYDRQPTYTPHLPPIYTTYTPHPTGYSPSSTYIPTYTPPYPTDTTTYDNYSPYPSGYVPSSSYDSSSSSSTYYPQGTGAYTQGYPGPVTTYNPPTYPRRAAAWFA